MVGPSLIFYYLIFMSTTFSQKILGKKLLLALKLCIKKKKQKDKTRKMCVKRTMNFGLPNLTKQKKKPRKTTKCHTKKNPRTQQNVTTFSQIFFFYS